MSKQTIALYFITIILLACNNSSDTEQIEGNEFTFEVKNLSDEEYPDNPDIGFRSTNYKNNYFKNGKIKRTEDSLIFTLQFFSQSKDTILLKGINISEFIPTIPDAIKSDQYLSILSCINQEWNRNQVRFRPNEFSSNVDHITRIDLARNCLNAYLWEIIVYTEEDGKSVPYAHGWFDFPHSLYAELFESKNSISFKEYAKSLENWVDLESKPIDFSILRQVIDTLPVHFNDKSNAPYPLAGARLKKRKEIVYPRTFKTMKDLQSDSTLFATFTPPGKYNTKDPRKTELGRIYHLKEVSLFKILSQINKDTLYELKLKFKHKNSGIVTYLVIGGITIEQFPILKEDDANEGWKHSMGIGNHTFYESYQDHNDIEAKMNPYYALLLDEEGKWLDSHKVGIDGPIFHYSDPSRKNLNLWLLSFERHALVGHYVIHID